MTTQLRFKVKTFVKKTLTKHYRYYFTDDVCAITGLTPRQIFNLFPCKGMAVIENVQTLNEAAIKTLGYEYPDIIEACENALQVD